MLLTEHKVIPALTEGLYHHINNKKPLFENVYRPGSEAYFTTIKQARLLAKTGIITELCEEDRELLLETEVGEFGLFEGTEVPLDFPMLEESLDEAEHRGKDVELNKPKRGGSKKFYVYVRKPGGGIKKVSFGDTTGLKAKINNPEARRNFAKRHNCATAKDKTKASYWSCRLPRYAKLLGLKSNFGGFW
jgi:hypothetical protein